MSVTCFNSSNDTLISFDYSPVEWNQLKACYTNIGLHMKCCGAPAVPKTSKLGTQFFAHKTDVCNTEEESIEHIRCKELIIKGAREAGWHANPEEAGIDNENNKWIADVLCSKNNSKIAFEVQLASQTFAEYKIRNKKYVNSGIRCYWLMRRKQKFPIAVQMILDRLQSSNRSDAIGHFPDRVDLPLFQVDVSLLEHIFVFFPWHHGKDPYQISLDKFVAGVLSGKLVFSENRWCWNE